MCAQPPAFVPYRCYYCAADLRPRFRYFHGTVSEDVNQPVVVDGDSLLLEAVAHTAVDWKHGGQPLTVVFFVEKLLAQLRYALALGSQWGGRRRMC